MRNINQITHYNLQVWLTSFTFIISLCVLQNVAYRKIKVCFPILNIFFSGISNQTTLPLPSFKVNI